MDPRPVSSRNSGPRRCFPRCVAHRAPKYLHGADRHIRCSLRHVRWRPARSNFAPAGSARSMSPDRVWTSIFGRFLPGFRSISPRSSVRSSDCVKFGKLHIARVSPQTDRPHNIVAGHVAAAHPDLSRQLLQVQRVHADLAIGAAAPGCSTESRRRTPHSPSPVRRYSAVPHRRPGPSAPRCPSRPPRGWYRWSAYRSVTLPPRFSSRTPALSLVMFTFPLTPWTSKSP